MNPKADHQPGSDRSRIRTPPASRHTGRSPGFDGLSGLQHTLGNSRVTRLLGGPRIQPKLTINQPGDRYEQEADRIADQVMRMPEPGVQRACACGGAGGDHPCAECAEEEEEADLHRSPSGPGPPVAPPVVHQVLASPGEALDGSARGYMERRFGEDFGHVRVHRDAAATASARSVSARAYTVGSDLVFGTGQYAPHTAAGRRLLAHELTHTLQQQGHRTLQRDFTPDPGQEGVETGRTVTGDVVHAQVDRADACGYIAHQNLDFNRRECTVDLPMAVRFANPGPAARRLPADRFEALATRFLEVANRRLNGWYTVNISGSAPRCTTPCAGRTIPIRVTVTRTNAPGAYEIVLMTGSGRANAGLLYEDSNEYTLWHEASHIALGTADEYEEAGIACRSGVNVEPGDWSIMGEKTSYRSRSILHGRHFSHVLHWFRHEFPGCTVALNAVDRPAVTVVTLRGEAGAVFGAGGEWGEYGAIALEHGIPLDRLRRARLRFGVRWEGMLTIDRYAWMTGFTLGFDYSTNRARGGFGFGAEGMLGGGMIYPGVSGAGPSGAVGIAEGGIHLGYAGPQGEFGLMGRAAVPLTSAPDELRKNPFFMLGIRAAWSW
jgi:hypothetical protein